jgi:type IX secretion system PorP/SprF family membrane protein
MKKLILLLSLAMFTWMLNAQDIHFSQFYESPLTLNPAQTGSFNGSHRFYLNYKDQWKSVAVEPYRTFAFSYDGAFFREKMESGHLGIGAHIFTDKAGDLGFGITQASLNVAYHLKMNSNNTLSAGIYSSFSQRSISNPENMMWGSQWDGMSGFDPNLPSNEQGINNNFSYIDVGAGMMWTYKTSETSMAKNDGLIINVGGAYFHANEPSLSYFDASSEKLSGKIVAHTRVFWGIEGTNLGLMPSAAFYKQGASQEILAGLLARYKLKEESKYTGFISEAAFGIGGYYRFADAFIAAAQIEMSDFAFGFSYDINVSGLTVATDGRGGFEVFLRYIVPNPTVGGSFY